ncbi:MAG: hypothetical protein JEZ02_12990 [Desulfatibacillum sp.]|nr:hypothetical protein [Desulfatibacillum sp.]
MPFETGFGQDDGLIKEEKEFEDIYEEEFTVERFQKMERRIMVQWIILLALVLSLASFMAVNFTQRLSKIADKGDVRVEGLSKDVNLKVEAIMQQLGVAEEELQKKVASVSEKAAQVGSLLDQATKNIQASKVDRSEVQKLLQEERAYTDNAVHEARVKTDNFKASVLESLGQEVKKLETSLDKKIIDQGKKVASLDKELGTVKRNSENQEDGLALLRTDFSTLSADMTGAKAANAKISGEINSLKADLTAFRAEQEATLGATRTEMEKILERKLDSLEKRLAALEASLRVSRTTAPAASPAKAPPVPSPSASQVPVAPGTSKISGNQVKEVAPSRTVPIPLPGDKDFLEQDLGN